MKDWFLEHRNWCMSVLRIYLGIGLFVKGIDLVVYKDALLRVMDENDVIWAGVALAHMIILTHILGGLLMAVGIGTRVGALIQIPNLVGAVFLIHGEGAGKVLGVGEELRFSVLVLVLLMLFVWYGSGPLSLKSYFEGKRSSASS